MPEPVTPTLAAAEPATPPPQPGTQTTPEGGAPEAAKEEPTFVTREELDRRLAEQTRQIKLSDKTRSKNIQRQIDEIKQVLPAGVQLNATQESELRQKVAEAYEQQEEAQASPQTPTGEDIPAEVKELLDPALNWMRRQVDPVTGKPIQITQDMPEYEKYIVPVLNQDNIDSADVTLAMKDAVTAYQERRKANVESADARLPSGSPTTTGEVTAKDARELWGKAYKS